MSRSPLVRTLVASVAIAAAVALGGCETDGTSPLGGRAFKPLSPEMSKLLEQKGMPAESAMLVRLFKQESELELWKQDGSGRFALLKTYPICRWSGELGPKIKEGDRQAPEGFYDITPAQMNPNSQFYLSFNLGYPNAFDKAHGRTGALLMVHGDCSSRGCYSMTDEQISEIYALARESFFGGQKSFQVQAYPFRMTPANLAKHRNNPHLAFWKMLKRGNDHFEVTGMEPKIDVCEKRYVFNAQPPANSSRPLSFNPTGRCPAYEVPEDVVAALNEKQRNDEYHTAELIRRGAPVAPIKTGSDGGMHPVFLAKVKQQRGEILDNEGRLRSLLPVSAPGTIPAHVNPPREPGPEATGTVATSGDEPTFANRPAAASSAPRTASAEPAAQSRPAGGGLFGNLFASQGDSAPAASKDESFFDRIGRTMGLRGTEQQAAAAEPVPAPKQRPAARPPQNGSATTPKPAPQGGNGNEPAAKATATAGTARPPTQQTNADQQARPASSASLVSGAQPVVQSSSFDNRWGALR